MKNESDPGTLKLSATAEVNHNLSRLTSESV